MHNMTVFLFLGGLRGLWKAKQGDRQGDTYIQGMKYTDSDLNSEMVFLMLSMLMRLMLGMIF